MKRACAELRRGDIYRMKADERRSVIAKNVKSRAKVVHSGGAEGKKGRKRSALRSMSGSLADSDWTGLTLSTLNPGSSSLSSLVVIVHIVVPASRVLLPLTRLRELNIVDVNSLSDRLGRSSRGEGRLESGDEVWGDRLWEDDVELDVEVSELVVSERGHSLSRDALEVVGLDDLPGLDGHLDGSLVEVNDGELSSSERGQEVDLLLHHEIVSPSLEVLVRLLLDRDDDVSWLESRRLVRLALEGDLLARLHALVDVDLEHLSLRVDLLPVALLASALGVNLLPRRVTVVTRLLDLGEEKTRARDSQLHRLGIVG